MKELLPCLILWLLFSVVVSSQVPPPPAPPRPMPKPTPAETTEKNEEQFAAEIVKSMATPVNWKQRTFPDFKIKVDMPRPPVRQTESFYDEALGNAKLTLYISVSDDATYMAARSELPYSITDDKTLRQIYREVLAGFSESSDDQVQHVRDFMFDGRLGVEMNSVPNDPRYQRTRSWAFLIGRDIYLLAALPLEDAAEHEPPDSKLVASRNTAFDRFFASLVKVDSAAPTAPAVPPILAGDWTGGVYRSTYFGFALKTPEKWLRVSEEDVEGIRKWGRDVVTANSDLRISVDPKVKRNLASFVSEPLGNDYVAMISVNLGIPGNSFEDARTMIKATETLLARVSNYEIVKRPFETKLGDIPAMAMINKIKLQGEVQDQQVYFVYRKGYVIGFSLTCYKPEDCKAAISSISTLRFEDQKR